MAELLQVERLSAGYGEAVVLQDVSFSLEEGATLAVSIASDTLAPGTTTYWRFSGSGITAADAIHRRVR